MTKQKNKITSKTLLEKIPAEKRWEITAKALTRLIGLRIVLSRSLLGKGEYITLLVTGWEKHEEILERVYGETGRRLCLYIKDTFNIPVEDAVGAAKLHIVAGTLLRGPEYTVEIVETTPERAVGRITNCAWTERYKEFEVDFALSTCHASCQAWCEEGLKAINPKLTYKLTKKMPRGDSYCEYVIVFKET